MAEAADASVPGSSSDGLYALLSSIQSVDGGDGIDTLSAGDFQLRWTYLWNARDASGGTYQATDPVSGQTWSVDFRNIESVVGSAYNDALMANTQITSLNGGAGDDTLTAAMDSPNPSYLRGGEGADVISGGLTFDDINGNQGNDTAHGWEDDDWVVGGKGEDRLFGDQGRDIVYGNIGDDTCDGGADADTVRGGQGDDVLTGGDGADWLSGDLGSDTVSGGSGADVFHAFAGAGIDRITDFNRAEGDRILLDAGSTFSVAQSGADTVITIGDGAQVVLAGVAMSSLTGDWIGVG